MPRKKQPKNKDGPETSTARATITKVDLEAGYVSTSLNESIGDVESGTHVTFCTSVWKDDEIPQRGQVVSLSDFRLFARGWRAMSVQPVTPDTEEVDHEDN